MKKTAKFLVIAMLVSHIPINSHAGDKEWATVGKILTGVAAGVVLADAFHDHHRHTPSVPVYPPVFSASYSRPLRIIVKKELITRNSSTTTHYISEPHVPRKRNTQPVRVIEKRIEYHSQPITVIKQISPGAGPSHSIIKRAPLYPKRQRVVVIRK